MASRPVLFHQWRGKCIVLFAVLQRTVIKEMLGLVEYKAICLTELANLDFEVRLWQSKGEDGRGRERDRDRQTDRQTGTDRQTDREREKESKRDRDRQRQREEERERQRVTNRQTDRQRDVTFFSLILAAVQVWREREKKIKSTNER